MNPNDKQFRIGLIALLILSVHIALCVWLLFLPRDLGFKSSIGTAYRQLILLGPFFAESRIKSTRHLSFRYKYNNTWSSFQNLTQQHFAEYRARPWKWSALAAAGYESHLIHTLGVMSHGRDFNAVRKSAAFRELNGFLMEAFIPASSDSVEIVGHAATYLPELGTHRADTAFVFKYNPQSIGRKKK